VLEEFDAENDPNLTDAEVNLHINLLWNNTLVENWQHYKNVFEKLHKTWPNLKNLRYSTIFPKICCFYLTVYLKLKLVLCRLATESDLCFRIKVGEHQSIVGNFVESLKF
jgi:hypothetical protein